MKIVIVGAGKIGYSLAEELANENHDITVVDIEKEKVKLLSDTLDVMTLCGNGAAISIQREANVDESDLLIAVTAQDELNMLACIVARKLGCKNTIARVRNLEYTEQLYVLKSELGLSTVSYKHHTAHETPEHLVCRLLPEKKKPCQGAFRM